MTIAGQNTAPSLPITIDDSNNVNLGGLWKFIRLGTLQLKLFLWHIHAYGTILGVMLLTLISLIYLGIHQSLGKLLPVLIYRHVASDGWNISSSK